MVNPGQAGKKERVMTRCGKWAPKERERKPAFVPFPRLFFQFIFSLFCRTHSIISQKVGEILLRVIPLFCGNRLCLGQRNCWGQWISSSIFGTFTSLTRFLSFDSAKGECLSLIICQVEEMLMFGGGVGNSSSRGRLFRECVRQIWIDEVRCAVSRKGG